MRKLFVIGNGFDMAHGLPTSYDNFKKFLIEEYEYEETDGGVVPELSITSDGDEYYDDDQVVKFLIEIISKAEEEIKAPPRLEDIILIKEIKISEDGKELIKFELKNINEIRGHEIKWSDLENSIGILEFSEFFDCFEGDDEDDDFNEYHKVYRNYDIAQNLIIPTLKITDYFTEWIETIEIENVECNRKFKSLINKEDLFLNFNYTRTLEDIYDVESVCHIHGVQGEELLFGHSNNKSEYDKNMGNYIGAEEHLEYIKNSLLKDTKSALEKNIYFFEKLENEVSEIYSYGFSFADVDMIYIKEICSRLNTENIIWYFNDYDYDEKGESYKTKLINCGYKGKFSTFNV